MYLQLIASGEHGVHGILALQAVAAALKEEIGQSLSRQCTMGQNVQEMIQTQGCAKTSSVQVKGVVQKLRCPVSIVIEGNEFYF